MAEPELKKQLDRIEAKLDALMWWQGVKYYPPDETGIVTSTLSSGGIADSR